MHSTTVTPNVPACPGDGPPAPATGSRAAMIALGGAGVCAFLNVFATQPLLPLFRRIFAATEAQAAWTVSAPTIAIALASPFIGSLADRVGRRRLIVASVFLLVVPTALAATSRSIPQLVAWRLLQGLVVPGVYAVGIAYIGDAWQGGGVGRAMAALITGNVLGGFFGRFLSGVIADAAGWRVSFLVLALLTLAGAFATARWLPPEPRRARASANPLRPLRELARRLDARLAATYAVGFNVLFVQVATFTYVTFHLAGAPFHLGTTQLSLIFVVYLIGAVITPIGGRWIDRAGARRMLAAALVTGMAGAALTLVPSLVAVIAGLTLCSSASFICQSAGTSFLQVAAPEGMRSPAAGVYISCYYVGGAVGGVLPAAAWHLGGWPACVALVATVQLASMTLALRYWRVSAP